ncbi:MAG: hypothetical protein ACRDK3_07240, partial [Actinomycetota bacterium]
MNAYEYSTPQPESAGNISGAQAGSESGAHERPPEPRYSFIDNICRMAPGNIAGRDPIFDGEISGCLLGFRPGE